MRKHCHPCGKSISVEAAQYLSNSVHVVPGFGVRMDVPCPLCGLILVRLWRSELSQSWITAAQHVMERDKLLSPKPEESPEPEEMDSDALSIDVVSSGFNIPRCSCGRVLRHPASLRQGVCGLCACHPEVVADE